MRRCWLVLALLLATTACGQDQPAGPAEVSDTSAAVLSMADCPAPGGGPAGAGGLPTLTFPCLSGGELTLGTAPGLPTVMNLWAPWCGPCKTELPLFEQLHASAPELVSVVGLVEKDTRASSEAYAVATGLSFPSGLDEPGALSTAEGLLGLPVTYFLRADGSVAHRKIGPIASYRELSDLLREHLDVVLPA